jgi:NAD(P)-dependent dehydrogenase (short-subunit alcohol dehydrogenase family)
MKIEKAVALVTGANRGLGRALVHALLDAGASRVYATARDVGSLGLGDPRVVPMKLDVTDPHDLETLARLGDVSLAINNAGVLGAFGLLGTPRADIEREFATNFYGPLAVAKALLPSLERSRGALVNVLTIASFAGMPALGGYAATKAAAFSLTQSLRIELRPRGVSVHAVFPGPIDTDMIRDMKMPKTSADDVAKAIVAGIERGEENIAPDPASRQIFELWQRDPQGVERTFATW